MLRTLNARALATIVLCAGMATGIASGFSTDFTSDNARESEQPGTNAPAQAAAQPAAPEGPKPASELVEQARLVETLRALPTKRSGWGSPEHQTGLRETEAWVEKSLKDLGYEVATHEFRWAPRIRPKEGEPAPKVEETQWRNFSVEIRGTTKPEEVLLVSAHFDAVPDSPGADDDGTGTAALLELARVLKGRSPARTIRLVFFNLEEAGLIGSSAYVGQHKKLWKPEKGAEGAPETPAKERIIGMISAEMLGYFSDEPNSQKSPIGKIEGVFDPPTVGDSIVIVGMARDQAFSRGLQDAMSAAAPELKVTTVDFLPVPIPDMMRSDHRPFVMAGLPGVMLTDTANFRNPHYHQPTDTIDTLDLTRFTLVVRGLAGAVETLANQSPDKP